MLHPRLQYALVTVAATAAAMCIASASHAQAPQLPPPDATDGQGLVPDLLEQTDHGAIPRMSATGQTSGRPRTMSR